MAWHSSFNTDKAIMGVDLSHWNGKVDFEILKQLGYQFCMLKLGGEETTPGKFKIDKMFLRYYRAAKANGLYVGAYVFANSNLKNCQPECNANYFINWLRKERCLLDYPLAIDIETQKPEDKAATTEYVARWCDMVEHHKWFAMIYGSDISTFDGMVESENLVQYAFWVARYGSRPEKVKHQPAIWQYTNKLYTPASKGLMDGNYAAYDIAAVIKAKHLNDK